MKKQVFIYDKDRESLNFLGDFFNGHKNFSASFFNNVKDLRNKINKISPEVLIAGSPACLDRLKPLNSDYTVIATLSEKELTKGLRSVINNDVEHYISPPYQKYDLEHKLKILSRKTERLSDICQEKKDLEIISEFTHLLSSTLDPQEVLFIIVKKLGEIIPVTRCSILSVDYSQSKTANVISSFENPTLENLRLDLAKYPEIRKALSTKKPVIIKDAMKDPLMKEVRETIKPLGIKSIVVVPILFRSEVIGTLFLRTSRKTYVFNDREIRLCQEVAGASANALNNAFLFHEMVSERARLEKLAITDFLTGVYNIRYLYHRLEEEFSRAVRYKAPLSCIMLDIDHFKRINDTYGHRTGDIVLREFATLIKKHTRKSDVFARYGGEEFIILLPVSDAGAAVNESRRIKKLVKEYLFSALKRGERITVSMGVSSYPNRKVKVQDELISLADSALLDAKTAGRDRIVVSK